VPASRKTEQHFIRYADTFKPKAGPATFYGSNGLLQADVRRNCVSLEPSAKYRQPVTEAQRVGWTWDATHDGFDAVPEAPAPAPTDPDSRDPYFGRKASHFTKHQQALLLGARTPFSGGHLSQNRPCRAII